MYTTNAIEKRKLTGSENHQGARAFSDRPMRAAKLIWLALRNITAKWDRAARHWKEAMNQFAILYADRFIRPAA